MTDRDAQIKRIATDILRLETLEVRRWDNLDFHDMAVWEIRMALEATFDARKAAANGRRAR